MTLSRFSQTLITVTSTLSLVTIGNLVASDFAVAAGITFDNGGFEDPIINSQNSWSTIGDVTTSTGIDGITPLSSPNQAIITNSYTSGGDRDDNNGFEFNQSTNNPVDADTITTNQTGDDLQTFLGLGTNALSIPRSPVVLDGGDNSIARTAKEGSGMYQDFTITISQNDIDNGTNGFTVSFDAAYLTNDGKSSDLGNQDFAFSSLFQASENSSGGIDDISVLFDSDGAIEPQGNNDFNDTRSYQTFTESVTGLLEGEYTYRAAYGVVDVDNSGRSSALAVDNFNVQQVPFEFSPTLGLLIVGGVIGGIQLRRHLKTKSSLEKLDL